MGRGLQFGHTVFEVFVVIWWNYQVDILQICVEQRREVLDGDMCLEIISIYHHKRNQSNEVAKGNYT
jgi:hypothetical protein